MFNYGTSRDTVYNNYEHAKIYRQSKEKDHSRSAALSIWCRFLVDPLSSGSLCQHTEADGSESRNSRFSVQSPFPPALRLVQEFIDTEHVRRILLKLHRTLAYLLLSGTLESYLCLS